MDALALSAGPDSPALRAALRAELDPRLSELRGFLDRRIAELSAELHASVELHDMGETRLASEITRIHEQIAQLVAAPSASTRNSGVELEAVVEATETAANTILEAAEAIQDWMSRGRDPDALPVIADRVNAIFEACAFQDLTGQRIRRAIQHLQELDGALQNMKPAAPPAAAKAVSAPPPAPVPKPPPVAPKVQVLTAKRTVEAPRASADLRQSEIDALLNW
jgi:chemotaxis protein CheZ